MKVLPCSLALALGLGLLFLPLPAEVVRPAPEFYWTGLNGAPISLSKTGQQPIILIIAKSAHAGAFKEQLQEVESLYRQYAGRKTLFCAAFTEKATPIHSDIPFLYVENAPAVAADYGLQREHFEIAVISPDRNLDLLSTRTISAEKLRDVIDNSYAQQSVRRAGQ